MEIAYYYVAMILIGGTLKVAASLLLEWDAAAIARIAISTIVSIPFFALFVRRVHDHGRSGLWILPLPAIMATSIYRDIRIAFHTAYVTWPELGYWQFVLLIPLVVILALIMVPGTVGSNRYGADPRTSDN